MLLATLENLVCLFNGCRLLCRSNNWDSWIDGCIFMITRCKKGKIQLASYIPCRLVWWEAWEIEQIVDKINAACLWSVLHVRCRELQLKAAVSSALGQMCKKDVLQATAMHTEHPATKCMYLWEQILNLTKLPWRLLVDSAFKNKTNSWYLCQILIQIHEAKLINTDISWSVLGLISKLVLFHTSGTSETEWLFRSGGSILYWMLEL